MYNFLKKTISSLVPKQFLFKNELFFRYPYAIIYSGKSHQCNVCNKGLKSFLKLENGDLLCPFCSSLSRTRRLWSIINNDNSLNGNVLHFSPNRCLYRKLKKNRSINYFSSDFENAFLADYKYDITAIDANNENFDLIICYHILEHIIDDKKAMSELFRVLKPNGIIYLQTPFKEGDIYENHEIISPKEREAHFGQEDHVRIYSVNGLKNRLEKVGFKVHINKYEVNKKDNYFGFKAPEVIFKLTK